ncbi:MAG: hypothetical protein HY821_02030 [Acidobacteria bacterium]|nr:hypothetical protein [Acidobacteriota bacterium]
MTWSRRKWLLGMAASSSMGGSAQDRVAFHYEAVFSPNALRWYTRFPLLVTGGVLSAEQTRKLRDGGPRLLAYEWSTGLYPGEPASHREWERQVRSRKGWLLSEVPSGGGSAAPNRSAYWYDFGNPDLRAGRTRWLAQLLNQSSYEGFFFDTVGSEQLPANMQAAFSKRWPGLSYDACQGQFLGELRRLIGPKKLIFLNQGYRHAAELLPHADMDLTESYFTGIEGPRTRFRAWQDDRAPWESIRVPMEKLVLPAAKRFPNVRFVHVNYATPESAGPAARYSWAVSRLWDHTGYLMVPQRAELEQDPIYFNETGAPAETAWEQEGSVVSRLFEHGIVAMNSSAQPGKIQRTGTLVPAGPDGFFFPRRAAG